MVNGSVGRNPCCINAASNCSHTVPLKETQELRRSCRKKLDASYRLTKDRRAAVERARAAGRVDPIAAPELSSEARRNKAGAS